MTYNEIINEVENGAKFTINFEKRTLKINRKAVDLSDCTLPENRLLGKREHDVIWRIENLYKFYKHSVPSGRSESHRKSYFKALPEKSLTDEDMMYGRKREVARCRLELYLLLVIIDGKLTWQEAWGSWFWQSPNDKDLIILREWIEPKQGGA